ncbi:MAG: chromate transporter [bacterium]|nr:chromate transporter [bacterium]
MILFRLFLAFAQIGLFAFGGGYAILPLIEKEVVNNLHWLTHKEFLEVVTISQLTPGPIAINAATFVGYKVGGVIGSAIATISVCLPPVMLVLIVVRFLKKFETNIWVNNVIKGLRPAVVALIASAAYSLVKGGGITEIKGLIIAIISFIILRTKKLDPILVLILAGIVGIVIYS